ncbi:MAG: hypothetical protein JST54_04215 [Deltaproteobacteria bacterium]|nr:hypothetical protein [Deltaproteobacteria bacterium]
MRSLVALVAVLVLAPTAARADFPPRLDHRGALGISPEIGGERADFLFVAANNVQGFDAARLTLGLELTLGLGFEGNELVVLGRYLHSRSDAGAAVGVAYRKYFGRDELKTYFQGGIKGDSTPRYAVGPWAQFGVMYELSALVGVFAQAELSVEVSQGIRVGYGGSGGVQLRTYVLE